MIRITFDPSVVCPGIAVFDGVGKLRYASLLQQDKRAQLDTRLHDQQLWIEDKVSMVERWVASGILSGYKEAVTEFPIVRRQEAYKGNDMLLTAASAGLFLGVCKAQRVITVKPGAWKGQVPKEEMCRRILDILTEEERALFERCMIGKLKSLHHNAIDAIGIGLWAVGRL